MPPFSLMARVGTLSGFPLRDAAAPAALAASLALAMSGCAPTTVGTATATPAPPAGTKYHNYSVGKVDLMPSDPAKWRAGVYVADIPGFPFPLPLFSDPEKQDVTTAHLTGCADGSFDEEGAMSLSFTFFYDETPDGDFSDIDTLCGGEEEEDVWSLGGDVTAAPFVAGDDDIARGADIVPTRTVVDRSVALAGPDGQAMAFPSPEGTEWRVLTRYDEPTELFELWAYEVVAE